MTSQELTLGLILLKEGKITKDQLRKALLKQGEIRRFGRVQRLGEVLAKLGIVPEEDVRYALDLQEQLLVPQAGYTALGLMLIEAGLLSPSQVYNALIEQQGTDKRLGEILVAQGVLNEAQLEPILSRQAEDRATADQALQEEMRSSGLLGADDDFVIFDMGGRDEDVPPIAEELGAQGSH